MAFRQDSLIQDYAVAVPFVNGTSIFLPQIITYGSMGVSFSVLATGAGNIYFRGTNFDGTTVPIDAFGNPTAYTQTAAVAVTANVSYGLSIGPTHILYGFNRLWVAYQPTANGTFTAAVNLRRLSA